MKTLELQGKLKTPEFKVPEILSDRIWVNTNIELTVSEKDLFSLILSLLFVQFTKEKIDIPKLPSVQIFFVENSNFSIVNTDSSFAGVTNSYIIYVMDKIRNMDDEDQIFGVFLEELCHHFWNIEDEIEVQYKVLDILRLIKPDLTLIDIYKEGERNEHYNG